MVWLKTPLYDLLCIKPEHFSSYAQYLKQPKAPLERPHILLRLFAPFHHFFCYTRRFRKKRREENRREKILRNGSRCMKAHKIERWTRTHFRNRGTIRSSLAAPLESNLWVIQQRNLPRQGTSLSKRTSKSYHFGLFRSLQNRYGSQGYWGIRRPYRMSAFPIPRTCWIPN